MVVTQFSWRVAVLAGAALAVSGCATGICDRPEKADPTPFNGGEVIGNTYRTSGFHGDLLAFPGGAFYEIHHQLGVEPTGFAFFLSFERDGVPTGSLAQAAGNQVELKDLDETSITVLNGSCSDYFLIVQAWTVDDATGEGGAPGAGGAGGG